MNFLDVPNFWICIFFMVFYVHLRFNLMLGVLYFDVIPFFFQTKFYDLKYFQLGSLKEDPSKNLTLPLQVFISLLNVGRMLWEKSKKSNMNFVIRTMLLETVYNKIKRIIKIIFKKKKLLLHLKCLKLFSLIVKF